MADLNSTNQLHNNANQEIALPPGSESSYILVDDDTFTYDIHNAPDSDSLLYEILSRLPIKPLFKFKCVSKHWLTLISQPSFKRFYMLTGNAELLSSLPFRIMYRYIYEKEIEGVLDLFRPESYTSSILFLSRNQHLDIWFKVLAVSNGLILCWSFRKWLYYVCDPVSHQWVALDRKKEKDEDFPAEYEFEGFVSRVNEDNVVTSYKVVRLEKLDSPSDYVNLDMYSSETGEWVDLRLRCPNPVAVMKRGAGPISFNGILHWFVYDHGIMVSFDPYKDPESCRVIQLPVDRDVQSEVTHDGLYRLCDGSQGKLRYFQVAPDVTSFYCFSMWDLKDYDNGEWCSEFKVTRSDLLSCDPELKSWLMKATFLPLSFHPFDLDIVYLRCVELACVVSYSIQNKRLDVACKPIATGVVEALSWRVVVPFVIPRWPTPVPIPPVPKKFVMPEVV